MRLDHPRCSFASSLDTFLSIGKEEWLARMEARESGRPLHQEQIAAWADCCDVLLHTLPAIQAQHPELTIIFEYELPYEAGRRPDVILLSKEQVVILEFKMKCRVLRADVDQVAAYSGGAPEPGQRQRHPALCSADGEAIRRDGWAGARQRPHAH